MDHSIFSAFMQEYKEYVRGERAKLYVNLKSIDTENYGDHVISTFSEYALG